MSLRHLLSAPAAPARSPKRAQSSDRLQGLPRNRAVRISRATKCAAAALAVIMMAPSPASADTASFQGLGDLPGGTSASYANAVSGDGSVVVGMSNSSNSAAGHHFEAFRWTSADGMQPLGDLGGGLFNSAALGVSHDGSVIVGRGDSGSPAPFRWTSTGGMQSLGIGTGWAIDVSGDGSIVVGGGVSDRGGEAFRWTSAGGVQWLGDLGGPASSSVAEGVSADGSTVVGAGLSGEHAEAFRWTSAGGMRGLHGGMASWAQATSADGSVVVGVDYATRAFGEAFRWTSAGGMQGLGILDGLAGGANSNARDVSGDGSIIVGISSSASDYQAFLWDAENGMRSLKQVLVGDHGLDLTGWRLVSADGISADGRTIVGSGINPSGVPEGWIATIPEPSSLSLLGSGGLFLLRRRHRGGPSTFT